MMFQADTAIAVELLALVAGTFLLIWSAKENIIYKGFAKTIAYFVIVVSILAILCTSYYAFRYWEDGYFNKPHTAINQKYMHNNMMKNSDMHKNMMNMNNK